MNAIEFDHVSKQYRLGLVSTKTLSHDIRRFWITNILGKEDPYLKIGETNDRASKGSSEYVWALRDINFNVEQGDVVGIIGKNGAGKSTLLKLLSRVTGPTTGQIRAHGRIGSLLEVGTGFHQEMTGRENIFMNGAILGMTKSEIDRKLDDIIAFSGCARYIDTPVKRYSSGMTVRLGFAVAAFLEPEILVVDEVLAVGDAEFQKKAIGKMQDVASNGRTVLFVSHNMTSIKTLCKHGILLENGCVKKTGNIGDVVDTYLGKDVISDAVVDLEHMKHDKDFSDGRVWMTKLLALNGKNSMFDTGTKVKCQLTINSQIEIKGVTLRIGLRDRDTIPVCMSMTNRPMDLHVGENEITFELDTSMLAPGLYSATMVLLVNGSEMIDVIRKAYQFEIVPTAGFNRGREWERVWFGNVSGFALNVLDE